MTTFSYHLIRVPQKSVHRSFWNHNSTAIDTDTSARSDPDENRIFTLCVIHEFDDLMQKDANGRYAHAVADWQHGSNLWTANLFSLTKNVSS